MPITELLSGIRLCHEAFGDPADPVVLLMHGLGSQLLLWEEGFCEGLAAEGFRVVRYDHRDSGCSTILEEGSAYTLSDQAADAVGLAMWAVGWYLVLLIVEVTVLIRYLASRDRIITAQGNVGC